MSAVGPPSGHESRTMSTLYRWILAQLEEVKDQPRVVLRDPLRLLSDGDSAVHAFAKDHGFTVIVASTNLVFRELYEHAAAGGDPGKLLVVDRSTDRSGYQPAGAKAPPPFYPDLLDAVPEEARLRLDLRRFLVDQTDDALWPHAVNDRRYARLILQHLDEVLKAHANLRAISKNRFTDGDLNVIVAYSALGVPESAFKLLDEEDYWKVGLLGHETLQEVMELAPEVGAVIKDQLRNAPAPFSWLVEEDPDRVVRAFYLAVILSQHTREWALLLNRFDPGLRGWEHLSAEDLDRSASRLVTLNAGQADRDLLATEDSLTAEDLKYLLLERFCVSQPARMAEFVERERFSTLWRGLCILLALDNLVAKTPAKEPHEHLLAALRQEMDGMTAGGSEAGKDRSFVLQRTSSSYANVARAYLLAADCLELKGLLSATVKRARATPAASLEFMFFWQAWNESRLNRLEYQFSQLERLVDTLELLPRREEDLPAAFPSALRRVKERVQVLAREVEGELDELNRAFQRLVAAEYPGWVRNDRRQAGIPVLTAQFLRFFLRHQWDPAKEKGVLLIFDGMRYDMWDELLRPLLNDRMEIIEDVPAISLLPSETHVTRKAISAGTFPDQFDMAAGEDKLLAQGLLHVIDFKGQVEVVAPEGAGTGETVRYRAGNLDVFIFELCDQALHKIAVKKLPDGREVPGRPLEYVYHQLVRNVLEREVAAVLRELSPGTKVFVTADHGFGRVHRRRLGVDGSLLADLQDCHYRNAWLKVGLQDGGAASGLRENVIEFTAKDLRMPTRLASGGMPRPADGQRYAASIIFPKVGFALARPTGPFDPDAFSHGGISLQELIVPMVVLKVRPRGEGLLRIGELDGPSELVEGARAEYRLRVDRTEMAEEDLRVEVEVNYGEGTELPHEVVYVPPQGADIDFTIAPRPEEASDDERRAGAMRRRLTVTVGYRDDRRLVRKSRSKDISVQLSSERVIRRVGNLGTILGLAPRDGQH